MYTFLIILFVIVCILLVVVILMQASKGGGLAASFGGIGSSSGVLGARGAASFLQKITIWLAVGYGVLSLIISFMSFPAGEGAESTLQNKLNTEQPIRPPGGELPPGLPIEQGTDETAPPPQQTDPGNEPDSDEETEPSEN